MNDRDIVGVIGLGNMGAAVAEGLLKNGFQVYVYDLNPKSIENIVGKGANKCSNPAELTEYSEIIFTSLPNSNAVNRVYFGDKGIFDNLLDNKILVELSTIEPETVININKKALERNSVLIDLPVSGSPQEAKEGKLKLIAAGDDEVIDKIEYILNAFGTIIKRVGDVGNAKTIKIVNNLMTMGNVIVAAEAFTIGVKAGVEPNLLFEVLNNSGGRSHHFSKRFPHVLDRNFNPGFTVDMGEKDIGLALDLSKKLGVPTPVGGIVKQMYEIALSEGLDREDIVSIIKLYENWANLVIKKPVLIK